MAPEMLLATREGSSYDGESSHSSICTLRRLSAQSAACLWEKWSHYGPLERLVLQKPSAIACESCVYLQQQGRRF